jgi:peptidoglycan/LPS O-acetylase OafA/YrhL
MDPLSPIPAIACLLAALASAFLLVKQFGKPVAMGRYATIDGMRGYLAFFVFLHHCSVWYAYLHTNYWEDPRSNLYTHFGQSSVLLFFMITGFLFFSKLIDGRTRPIDWGKLYVSRFLRLVPLYFFAMCLLFIVIAIRSHGTLNESISTVASEVLQWLSFTIPGGPDINGISYTFIVVAGVTWSLPYEWLFYFSLPALALIVGVIPPLPYIALCAVSVIGMMLWGTEFQDFMQMDIFLLAFLGGMVAALLVRSAPFCRFAVTWVSSLFALGTIAAAVALYPTGFDYVPVLLQVLAFILIACGNSLFGVLLSPISRTLGEMAYSIYLLHGLVLYVTFKYVLGPRTSMNLSPTEHWLLMLLITPVLIALCFLSFRYIESPPMQKTAVLTAWLRSRLAKLSRRR